MKKQRSKTLFCVMSLIASFTVVTAQDSVSKEPGINLSYMNPKISPGQDFYQYVNGRWLDQTKIPDDRAMWGSFNELMKKTDHDALSILKEASKNPKYRSDTDQGKLVNLFATVLDTVGRNRTGIKPLLANFKKIDAIKNVADLQKYMVDMELEGGSGFFGINIEADKKNSSKNVVILDAAELGLPDKDYYISEDKDSKEKRGKYQLYVAKMMQFIGESPEQAKRSASGILALETELSKPRLDRVENRDDLLKYNPMTIAELQKITPAIHWEAYFTGIGLPKLDRVVVKEPRYMKGLQTIFTENKTAQWKEYLKWYVLNNSRSKLTTDIETAGFNFYGKTLRGALKQLPREQKALDVVNSSIGQALGKLYVEKVFPAEAKTKAVEMIKNIIEAYKKRIHNLTWMSEATKVKAIEKLDKITIKVGYPDQWEDYSALEINGIANAGSYYENSRNLAKWNFRKDIEKLNKPVDKTEWMMSPQTVNAYYNPNYNEIVFPAAFLQPPFYNYQADEAVNYGGIGAFIGHEISHGFDDIGSRFNADGNLVNWWTPGDLEKFKKLGTALADQYSALEPLPEIHLDGKSTLGENIGDLGGVNASYDGLQLYLKAQGNPGLIDGFTPEQRFFISWATVWRIKMRDEVIKNLVKTDPHSPPMYRAYVPLQDIDAFYDAFKIKSGDKMFLSPEKRVKIW